MSTILIIATVIGAIVAVHTIRGELVTTAWDHHVDDALEVTR